MKILLLTDSLALPRDTPEVCNYQDTWPSLLRNEGYLVHQVSIGGATSIDLLRQSHYHESFKPDIVIVQVGIVDCAPRFISKREKFLLSKVPFGKNLISIMNRPKIRKWRKMTYVDKSNFRNAVNTLRKCFKSSIFIVTEIIGGEGYEASLPGIETNMEQYNHILKLIPDSKLIEYSSLGITMSDHHHLNTYGHKVLYEHLIKQISEIP